MNNTPLVITTIFDPSKPIARYAKIKQSMVVVADTKTPLDWKHDHATFLSVERQRELFPIFADALPYRHYARKNIGYLFAMKNTEVILETDDDNSPYPFFPNFHVGNSTQSHLSSSDKFVNVYELMTTKKQAIWPRGFPIELLREKRILTENERMSSYVLQQGLIDRDTDVDAIYRLTNNAFVKFEKNKSIALAPHNYAPINSQNTCWKKPAFLFMYLPGTVASRVTDIYRGYIAQRLIWEIEQTALFLSPSVYQDRNPHNYLRDFEEELPIYLRIREFINTLEQVRLSGTIESKMVQIYAALIEKDFVKKEELGMLKLWIAEIGRIA